VVEKEREAYKDFLKSKKRSKHPIQAKREDKKNKKLVEKFAKQIL
jgi:hypothetical protein